MGIISFLVSDLMKAVRGQKRHEEVDLMKKCLIKVAQQPQKPLSGSNQI